MTQTQLKHLQGEQRSWERVGINFIMAGMMWGRLAVDPTKGAAVPGFPSHWTGRSTKHLDPPTPNICTAAVNWEVHKCTFCYSSFYQSLWRAQWKLRLRSLQVKSGKRRWGISGCWNEGLPPVWTEGVVLLPHRSVHSLVLLNLQRSSFTSVTSLLWEFQLS